MLDYLHKQNKIRFVFPIDGDYLNINDGKIADKKLIITAKVFAEENKEIYINGVKARYNNGYYESEISLDKKELILTATQKDNLSAKDEIKVYYNKKMVDKYRISMDDTILLMKDITINKDIYSSIFENPILKIYQEAHKLYDARIHLNLFYETCAAGFTPEPEYFNLSMMTDKFKTEWEDNSNWLELSFHSLKENPGSPYKNTTRGIITEDCLKVHKEIIRFAGEKCLAQETTVHFGAVNKEGVEAIRDIGYKVLAGYFEMDEWDNPLVAYFYNKEEINRMGERDFFTDHQIGMTYGRIDRVLNYTPLLEKNLECLEEIKKNKTRSGFLELMIHEQYFYSNYVMYIPKFKEIVLGAAKWAMENGYKGAFLREILD